MPEGRVYRCSWSVSKNGLIKVWVAADKKVNGSGRNFEEAEEALFGSICRTYGDGEPNWDYDRPHPDITADSAYLQPHIVYLVGDTRDRILNEPATLYANGICNFCGAGKGTRTDQPLQVRPIESGFEGAFFNVGQQRVCIYSARFLEELPEEFLRNIQARKVNIQGRSKREFYELIGQPIVGTAALRGGKVSGWTCPHCEYKVLGYYGLEGPLKSVHEFISRALLPDPLPQFFLIDNGGLVLATNYSTYRQMRTKRSLQGILGLDIGVLSPDQIDPSPQLKPLAGRDAGGPRKSPK